jgi:hypothetical protein
MPVRKKGGRARASPFCQKTFENPPVIMKSHGRQRIFVSKDDVQKSLKLD